MASPDLCLLAGIATGSSPGKCIDLLNEKQIPTHTIATRNFFIYLKLMFKAKQARPAVEGKTGL
jgi:hypothetical protein